MVNLIVAGNIDGNQFNGLHLQRQDNGERLMTERERERRWLKFNYGHFFRLTMVEDVFVTDRDRFRGQDSFDNDIIDRVVIKEDAGTGSIAVFGNFLDVDGGGDLVLRWDSPIDGNGSGFTSVDCGSDVDKEFINWVDDGPLPLPS